MATAEELQRVDELAQRVQRLLAVLAEEQRLAAAFEGMRLTADIAAPQVRLTEALDEADRERGRVRPGAQLHAAMDQQEAAVAPPPKRAARKTAVKKTAASAPPDFRALMKKAEPVQPPPEPVDPIVQQYLTLQELWVRFTQTPGYQWVSENFESIHGIPNKHGMCYTVERSFYQEMGIPWRLSQQCGRGVPSDVPIQDFPHPPGTYGVMDIPYVNGDATQGNVMVIAKNLVTETTQHCAFTVPPNTPLRVIQYYPPEGDTVATYRERTSNWIRHQTPRYEEMVPLTLDEYKARFKENGTRALSSNPHVRPGFDEAMQALGLVERPRAGMLRVLVQVSRGATIPVPVDVRMPANRERTMNGRVSWIEEVMLAVPVEDVLQCGCRSRATTHALGRAAPGCDLYGFRGCSAPDCGHRGDAWHAYTGEDMLLAV